MNTVFIRRVVVAVLVTVIAWMMFQVSYFQENQEAYLFPSIITLVVLIFSITSLVREGFDLCIDDIKPIPFLRLLPALICMIGAVFTVEHLGMYTTSFITLILLTVWYSPEENWMKRLISSLVLSVGFIIFMYLLFSVVLGVQMPRGLLI